MLAIYRNIPNLTHQIETFEHDEKKNSTISTEKVVYKTRMNETDKAMLFFKE